MKSKTIAGKAAQIRNAQAILHSLGFGVRQSNELAALVLLALVNLKPKQPWLEAEDPLRGITPIIAFISQHYGVNYAPNTRETIRDEAVKFLQKWVCFFVIPINPTVRRIAAKPFIKSNLPP
jgi:hypothetical protein